MAAYSKNINLIGVSTVAGNQILEKTTNNALNVLNIIGCLKDNQLSFPLLQGHHRPLLRRPIVCEEIFGKC
jgi:inosine-uridine nucleoside N-ribohydrolase